MRWVVLPTLTSPSWMVSTFPLFTSSILVTWRGVGGGKACVGVKAKNTTNYEPYQLRNGYWHSLKVVVDVR